MIQQAGKIEKDSLKDNDKGEVDGELRALAVKWKTASRMAADELFGVVKDRVNRWAPRNGTQRQLLNLAQDRWAKSMEGEAGTTERVQQRI